MKDEQKRNRTEEHPSRPEPETKPDTMEGPGARRERKAEEDAGDTVTRRGER